MKEEIKIYRSTLKDYASRCRSIMSSQLHPEELLKIMADTATAAFGEYFSPRILQDPDEISVNFIELLDQIVFEVDENIPSLPIDENIRDYIMDDLYVRINIYIDIFTGIDTYKANLKKRILTHDDTEVIRYYNMDEYITLLINEYDEQPALKESILRALLSFEGHNLINFYYRVANDESLPQSKILAFMGLKQSGSRFSNWDLLKTENSDYRDVITYIEEFDSGAIGSNGICSDFGSLLFTINYIELNIKKLRDPLIIGWVAEILKKVLEKGNGSTYFPRIYNLVSNIFMFAREEFLKNFSQCDEHLVAFIEIIDTLPWEFFDRIRAKLFVMGDDFQTRVNNLIESDKISLNEGDSNTMSFLLLESEKTL
jgi:hypothetical protein